MKLLIVTNLFPSAAEPTRGLYSLQQAQALAGLAEVTVIAPVPWVPPWLPAWRGLARWGASGRVPSRETIQGLTVFHPRYVVLPKVGRRWDAASFARAIRPLIARLVREGKADAIFATWAYPDVVATAAVAGDLGVPVIGGVLGSDINLYATGWRGARIAAALRRCAAVVCVTEPLRQAVARVGVPADRLHVVLNGVDAQRFQPRPAKAARAALGLPAERPLILFIGNLVTVKGPDVLVEAFARLAGARGRGPRPLLVFVGAGALAGALARRVRALGLDADVRFAGAQPHERIPEWLGAADALCVPSRAEGCPNVVLEASAAGRPVVASRVGGIPDLVREGVSGLLVPPEDPEALAAALGEALSRRWDPAAIRAEARGGWGANAQAILRLAEAAPAPRFGPTVLHVLRYSLPNMSGYTVRSQALIEGQRAHGVRPVVVTSVRHEAAADLETIHGIRYHRCRVSSRPFVRWLHTQVPLARTLATMASLARTIERVGRAEGARLIHAHSPVMCGFPALLAARRLRVPFVYEVRALWEDAAVDQEKTREGSVAYRLARALETFVLRRADRIVVICEGLRRELAGRGLPPERIVVSPNGVDPAVFTPRDGKDPALLAQYRLEGRKVIGFIGSFFQFEGLECLLRAVPHLRRLDPAIHVVIVGGGDRERALRHEAQAAGLDGAVVFTGRVPHEQVAAYYSIMDALVYPRLSRRITELVTPLKPLEAMALQRPVIASDVGGLKELVRDGETGLLFKADDPEALARACARLVQDPALAQRLAAQGRAFVERERSWHAICARNVALYREMLPS